MFGRLKLALVALVLLPSAAFAADHPSRHAPGSAVVEEVVAAGNAAPVADTGEAARKHHSSAKAEDTGPSTIAAFLDRLGHADGAGVVASTGAKQAAASIGGTVVPSRAPEHQPG